MEAEIKQKIKNLMHKPNIPYKNNTKFLPVPVKKIFLLDFMNKIKY